MLLFNFLFFQGSKVLKLLSKLTRILIRRIQNLCLTFIWTLALIKEVVQFEPKRPYWLPCQHWGQNLFYSAQLKNWYCQKMAELIGRIINTSKILLPSSLKDYISLYDSIDSRQCVGLTKNNLLIEFDILSEKLTRVHKISAAADYDNPKPEEEFVYIS